MKHTRILQGCVASFFDGRILGLSGFLLLASLSAFCFWQGERAAEPSSLPPTPASARADVAPTKYVTEPIRDAQLLEWVLADNPELPHDVEGDFGEVDPLTWRTLTLRMTKDDGAQLDIQLARPAWWLEEARAAVGQTIFLDIEEMGAVGDAEVLAIASCPALPPRPSAKHRLITGKFVHPSGDVLDVYVDGLGDPIGVTAHHPFWSEDRQAFVPVAELRSGEALRGADGRVSRIVHVNSMPRTEVVCNLEVDGEHVYHVSSLGVLVHNSYPLDNVRYLSELGDGSGRLALQAAIARRGRTQGNVAVALVQIRGKQRALTGFSKSLGQSFDHAEEHLLAQIQNLRATHGDQNVTILELFTEGAPCHTPTRSCANALAELMRDGGTFPITAIAENGVGWGKVLEGYVDLGLDHLLKGF